MRLAVKAMFEKMAAEDLAQAERSKAALREIGVPQVELAPIISFLSACDVTALQNSEPAKLVPQASWLARDEREVLASLRH
jgi:hypothetical protein